MRKRSDYAPSILQFGNCCFLCGRTDRKLDRHEVFFGPYRQKSKEDGLWVLLCHDDCHEGSSGPHRSQKVRRYLSAYAQGMAMEHYGWTIEQWRERYGKDWT